MKDKYGRAVTVRVYGKTLNEWTVTAEWHEREYEKLVQKEVEYREYDSESGDLYANDNDGELEFTRKPAESKLHKLYEQWQYMSEADFDNIAMA